MTCTSGRCLVSLHCHKSSSYITVVPLEETEVLAVWVGYWDTWILDYSGHSTDIAVGAEAPPLHLENTELPDQEKTTNFLPSQATVNYQSLAMNLSCWLSAHSAALKFPFTITLYVDLKKKPLCQFCLTLIENKHSVLSFIGCQQPMLFNTGFLQPYGKLDAESFPKNAPTP